MLPLPREYSDIGDLRRGSRGKAVRLVQEWLSLHGTGTAIDKAFGAATEAAVRQFQQKVHLPATGIVDSATFQALTAPLRAALAPQQPGARTFAQMAAAYAAQHLHQHPREIGGQNCGPWVRLYTRGREGAAYPWCAAFVSFVLAQTADTLGTTAPVRYTLSCDELASLARTAGLLVRGEDIASGRRPLDELRPCAVFLVRKRPGDWTHTGFALGFETEHYTTIEGNTNDAGDREGYEVCNRVRTYAKKDFIVLH